MITLFRTVSKGRDHLQLIKFWPLRAPGKRVCGGRKFWAPPYYSQRAVFASLLTLFFIEIISKQNAPHAETENVTGRSHEIKRYYARRQSV